jgi:CheY-like chemotaxis protein
MDVGMQKKFMTPREVSQMLSISVSAVNTLAGTGELASVSDEDTGLKCFLKEDVLDFAHEHEIPVNEPRKTGYRVLIVDDEKSFAQMLEKWIQALPYEFEIDIAHNGFQAGYKARQYVPDLIFLDVMMPGVSGMEVVVALKSEPKTEHIRIIGLTGAATENTARRMVRLGAEQVLRKPFTHQDLVNAIKPDSLGQFAKQAIA